MSSSADLITVLKHELKLAGITYAQLGVALGPLEGEAALRGGLALAQHHALHVVVDVERTGHQRFPRGAFGGGRSDCGPCFARGGLLNVYTGAERVRQDPGP